MLVDMLYIAQCEPGGDDQCLCGSGRKFKNCCKGHYSSDALEHAIAHFEQGEFSDALRACRLHLTWYILSHRAHTIPLLEAGDRSGTAFLEIDLRAMSEIVGALMRCYSHAEIGAEFPLALDRLRNAIESPRWIEKVCYFRSLWYYLDQSDPGSARREIVRIDIQSCRDPEILELYLDLATESLTFRARIDMVDRILDCTESEASRLQYSLLKGIYYSLIGEADDVEGLVRDAVERYRSVDESRRTKYGETILAHTLQHIGRVYADFGALRQALSIYRHLANSSPGSRAATEYRAMIDKSIADCHLSLREWEDAVKWYEASFARCASDLVLVFLAKAHLGNADIETARRVLRSLDPATLDRYGLLDLALVWADLATHTQDLADIEVAAEILGRTNPQHPLFKDYKHTALLELSAIREGASPSGLSKILRAFGRYLQLNPNFFGLGVNLNNVIDDLIDSKGSKQHKREE